MSIQCPDNESQHVQVENVLIEILDDNGRPCQTGETGQGSGNPFA